MCANKGTIDYTTGQVSHTGASFMAQDYYENGILKIKSSLDDYNISIKYTGKNIAINIGKNNSLFDNLKYIDIKIL